MYVWVAALVLVAADLVVRRPTHHNAALGVFFGFQVTDFDVFLVSFLCAILFFLAIYLGLFVVLSQ